MREMGFITIHPGVLGVFVNSDHIGTIKELNGSFRFILGKSRKSFDGDVLRAIANKIDMMNKESNHEMPKM